MYANVCLHTQIYVEERARKTAYLSDFGCIKTFWGSFYTHSVFYLHLVTWRLENFPFNFVLFLLKFYSFLSFLLPDADKVYKLEEVVGEGDQRVKHIA